MIYAQYLPFCRRSAVGRAGTRETEMQMRCEREGDRWGEYVRAGETYAVSAPQARGGSYHFENVRTGGGTFIQAWSVERALKNGWLVEVRS